MSCAPHVIPKIVIGALTSIVLSRRFCCGFVVSPAHQARCLIIEPTSSNSLLLDIEPKSLYEEHRPLSIDHLPSPSAPVSAAVRNLDKDHKGTSF
ncbi:hypothetical protein L2E82_02363 [Cichorium intybus]|uniref:Uncharacterized protein n=1 Tax=Cichorium intybus TaxID=13427 RepID=A0ACB9H135_CICIN|nr:hypothetical protein L2E82_02363 [Cichorium intybus]